MVEVSHRFKCILPTGPGDKPGDLLMVSLDHNFFAIGHDAVENATEIAGQFCCAYRFHFSSNTNNLILSDNTYFAETCHVFKHARKLPGSKRKSGIGRGGCARAQGEILTSFREWF